MAAQIYIDEAQRMLNKIGELGKYHENSKFLAREILSDLKKAEGDLHCEESIEVRTKFKEQIRELRINLLAYQFSL